MTAVKTDIGAFSQAGRLPFAPTSNIPQTDVQQAIEAVRAAVAALNAALAAPQYLTGAASGDLANERVVTDTATVAWDLATGGQAKANVVDASVSNAKLANMAQATVKGRAAGAGTGAPVDLTASQLLDILKAVDGTGSGLDADTLDGVEGAAFALLADLASNDNGKGAALVGIEDAGSYFAGTTVEAALAYLGAAVAALAYTYQPLDGDLTAIAALATTAAGRSVLEAADPNEDRVMAWDDSVGKIAPIAVGDLQIESTPVSGDKFLMYKASGGVRAVDFDDMPSGGGSGNAIAMAIVFGG